MNRIVSQWACCSLGCVVLSVIPSMGYGQEVLHAIVGDSSQWDTSLVEFNPVGDVNGDGVTDFIYGSPMTRMHRIRSGSDWSTLVRYRSIQTTVYHDAHGHGAAGLGYWDDDDVPDYAIGAPNAFTQQFYEGCVRVFSGATHTMIQEISEHIHSDKMGDTVVSLGDVDGDGYTELATTGISRFYVRIYSGPDGHLLREHSLPIPEPRVAPYGDFDGDGAEDYLIGDYGADSPLNSGSVLLYSGKTGTVLRTFNGQREWEKTGVSVCAAGDWNGDGIIDVASGAPGAEDPQGGSLSGVYVFSGADASVLRFFDGADYAQATSGFGYSVASGKDVNGDGFPDLIVGAPAQTFGDFYYRQGAVYVISGRTGVVLWRLCGKYDEFDYNLGRLVYMIDDHDSDGLDEWVVSDVRYMPPTHNGRGRITIYRGSVGDRRTACPTTPNSAGAGARLYAAGPISLRNNFLSLSVEGGTSAAVGMVVYGESEPGVPFGDGVLCVKSPLHMADFLTLDTGGAGLLALDLWTPPFSSGPGAVHAGDSRAFQFLYQDSATGARNASDSIVIRFVP